MGSAATPDGWDFDVLVSGMVFLDIVFTDLPCAPTPGTEVWTGGMGSSPGGIANLAVATARLGLRTSLAAGFGDDGYADWCRRVLADQEGVDLSLSRTFEHWHTPVTVSMAYDGDRAMVTHGHPAPLTSAQMIGTAPRARAVVVELEDDPWWLQAKAAGSLVFADVGWDPSGAWDRKVLDRLDGCHSFMPNHLEAQAYTRTATPEAALAALADLVPLAVVTSGCRGAMAVDGSTGEQASVPSVPATALDPTGAGDVFGASLVVGTLAGWPLMHRLQFSALCASLAVRQFGGALAAPGWGDLADWWTTTAAQAAAGDPAARALREAYGFLPDILPAEPAKALRRAEATIARLSDLHPTNP
ncbi:PfkB family carbohydrate kinase [Pengzhenrongella phosphoraccumulans]|uniref:PfkB family carbohydrate kinase n=1 Tax=Pengzhenrongella phosphoraccumulans TaxID=3114394 RepID=UPI00388E3274